MARYQVILAYDGAGFIGFQRQAPDRNDPTVQGVVEAALRRLGWQGQAILAAGRTDTGVHAAGQVIAFDLDWPHPVEALQAAMNANLPPEVAARRVCVASADFHPRYDAWARRYRYQVYCQPVRDPVLERYAWRVWPAVNLERLQSAAGLFVGEHDFAAFGTPPKEGGPTRRIVFSAAWQAGADGRLTFEICGNAFLYRMVRRLVGFQIEIGHERRNLLELEEILRSGEKAGVRGLAPAHGLTLVEVLYPTAEYSEE
jgi:tRNA pseudouridine38-40 synthase